MAGEDLTSIILSLASTILVLIFLVASVIRPGRWNLVAVLIFLVYTFFRLKLPFWQPNRETINCWKHAYEHKSELSEVDIFSTNLIDSFASHGLIGHKLRDEIILEIENFNSEDILENVTPPSVHLHLLTDEFPRTGNKGYKIYCELLRLKPNYEKFGLQLCQLCEPCCVDILKGNTLDNGSCSYSQLTPAKKNRGVRISIDSTCKEVFDEWKSTIEATLYPLPVQVSYVDDRGYDERHPIMPVLNESLVCTRKSILMALILGVNPDGVDREELRTAIAVEADIDPKLVNISIKREWVWVRVPARAGFQLLSVSGDAKRWKKFNRIISLSLQSTSEDYISIQIQLSALQPHLGKFMPPTNARDRSRQITEFKENVRPHSWRNARTSPPRYSYEAMKPDIEVPETHLVIGLSVLSVIVIGFLLYIVRCVTMPYKTVPTT